MCSDLLFIFKVIEIIIIIIIAITVFWRDHCTSSEKHNILSNFARFLADLFTKKERKEENQIISLISATFHAANATAPLLESYSQHGYWVHFSDIQNLIFLTDGQNECRLQAEMTGGQTKRNETQDGAVIKARLEETIMHISWTWLEV